MPQTRNIGIGEAFGRAEQNALLRQQTRNAQLLEERTTQGNTLAQQFFGGGGTAGGQNLNELAAVDPQRAQQAQALEQKQNEFARTQRKQQAAQTFRKAQFVAQSNSPKKLFLTAFPEDAKRLADSEGVDVNELDDDDVLEGAQAIMEHFGPLAEFEPEDVETATIKFRAPNGDEVTAIVNKETGEVIRELGRGPSRTEEVTGSLEDFGLSKRSAGALEEKQFNAVEALARVNEVESSFDPKFLELGTRFNAAKTSAKAKMGIKSSAADVKQLKDFSVFKKRAISNINRTLNDLSGAAVSPQEAIRIRSELPDPGDGFFDGDDPITFEAKMRDATKLLRSAIIRAKIARNRGLAPLKSGIELTDIPGLIDARGEELTEILKAQNPDMEDEAIDIIVKDQLNSEFGSE